MTPIVDAIFSLLACLLHLHDETGNANDLYANPGMPLESLSSLGLAFLHLFLDSEHAHLCSVLGVRFDVSRSHVQIDLQGKSHATVLAKCMSYVEGLFHLQERGWFSWQEQILHKMTGGVYNLQCVPSDSYTWFVQKTSKGKTCGIPRLRVASQTWASLWNKWPSTYVHQYRGFAVPAHEVIHMSQAITMDACHAEWDASASSFDVFFRPHIRNHPLFAFVNKSDLHWIRFLLFHESLCCHLKSQVTPTLIHDLARWSQECTEELVDAVVHVKNRLHNTYAKAFAALQAEKTRRRTTRCLYPKKFEKG